MNDSVVRGISAEILRIPVRPGAAMQLMQMLDDPSLSLERLGAVIETDPALSTRLLALANSSFYALRTPAASAWRAESVVGLATVRSVVATSLLDIGTSEGISVPEGFWSHATATAAVAGLLAPHVSLVSGDAFALGLLHDVGEALVFRRARDAYEDVVCAVDQGEPQNDAELRIVGATHEAIGAAALTQLHFPEATIDAVQSHHGETEGDALAAVLGAADVFAHLVVGDEAVADDLVEDRSIRLGITAAQRQVVLERACGVIDQLGTTAVKT